VNREDHLAAAAERVATGDRALTRSDRDGRALAAYAGAIAHALLAYLAPP